MDSNQLSRQFTYNAPNGDQVVRYERIRAMGKQCAELIDIFCPDSDEKDLAIVNLRQAIMWANAAIACNE